MEINFWFNTPGRKYLPIHRVQVSYTFLDSDKEIKGLESKYILDHLKHQLILDIRHPLAFQVQGNWKLRFEQRVSGEKYVLCDSQIYKKFENVELFARITNLFDIDYSEVGEIPMPGRWVVTGLKFGIRPGK
ncbi:hypothetical protein DRP98_06695 [candidate division KSB1 bacterium]|nr:MAG: hypothetical protein DRP98_06695 [candidate division KSB1 bacterium]